MRTLDAGWAFPGAPNPGPRASEPDMQKPFNPNPDDQPAAGNAPPTPGRTGRKRRGRPRKGTPDWKPRFLRLLRSWHGPVLAARKAGVNPRTAYKAREADPAFRDAWDEALERRREWLDLQVLKRGLAGSDRCLLAHARAHIPELYGKQDPPPSTAPKPVSVIKILLPAPKPPPVPVPAPPDGLRELPEAAPALATPPVPPDEPEVRAVKIIAPTAEP